MKFFNLISDIQNWSSGNIDWEQARIKIDEQLSTDPENPSLHFNRAVLYYNLGLALSERTDFSEKQKLDTIDIVYKISIE